jgi:hypothetical protein
MIIQRLDLLQELLITTLLRLLRHETLSTEDREDQNWAIPSDIIKKLTE